MTADHEELSIASMASIVRAEASGRHDRFILGIAGAPGAGKSTVAAQLKDALATPNAQVLGMDGFHLANQVLEALGRRDRKGAWDTFDSEGFASLMQRLRHQPDDTIIYAPEFRREIEESIGSAEPVEPTTDILIVEGNYLLLDRGHFPEARSCMDAVWFLEPPESVRQERLIRRHEQFGKTPDEARHWALTQDEQNAQLIHETAPAADRIITVAESA